MTKRELHRLRRAGLPTTYAAVQGESYAEAHRRAVREYYQRHKALGLCVKCPEKASRGGFCEKHAEAHLEHNKRRHGRRLRQGRCVDCGKVRSPHSANYCARCSERRNGYQRERKRRVYGGNARPATWTRTCSLCHIEGHDRRTCLLRDE